MIQRERAVKFDFHTAFDEQLPALLVELRPLLAEGRRLALGQRAAHGVPPVLDGIREALFYAEAGRHVAEEAVPFGHAAGLRGCRAAVVCLCCAIYALVRMRTACFGDGDLSAPARCSNQGRAAEHSCPAAVGAGGAPATRRAAAKLVHELVEDVGEAGSELCLLYTSPSPRDRQKSRMPSSA